MLPPRRIIRLRVRYHACRVFMRHRCVRLHCRRFLFYHVFARRHKPTEVLSIKNSNSKDLPINEEIKFPPTKTVRVVGPDSEQLGLMQYSNARKSAFDQGYDLVLIAAQADPPVCRIMDYGKFCFERDKREKEAKKKQQISELKEIQLTCHIDVNDFNTKVNHARRFLENGDKVRVVVKFKGRQVTHVDIGRDLLDRFLEAVSELGSTDRKPTMEGRFMSVTVSPLKSGVKKQTQKTEKTPENTEKKADAAKTEIKPQAENSAPEESGESGKD